jgi:4-hydroxy-tetrahydrodipicolinate reductase
MKLGLLGYGKMNRLVEEIAKARGHEVLLRIRSENAADLSPENLQTVDMLIDFSRPELVARHVSICTQAKKDMIIGTTGWLEQLADFTQQCQTQGTGILYASNFSVGVNIFFELNRRLAELMRGQTEYKVSMQEIHHTQKLDAPSGTALSLAKDIQSILSPTELPIESLREGAVIGTHIIDYQSDIDTIQIRHEAHNRKGFALGAVLAAEWLQGKKGVFTMQDMLKPA